MTRIMCVCVRVCVSVCIYPQRGFYGVAGWERERLMDSERDKERERERERGERETETERERERERRRDTASHTTRVSEVDP